MSWETGKRPRTKKKKGENIGKTQKVLKGVLGEVGGELPKNAPTRKNAQND